MTLQDATTYYGVSKSSLGDRTKGKVAIDANPGAKQKLQSSDERAVVQYAQALNRYGFPLNPQQIRNKARELAINIRHNKAWRRTKPRSLSHAASLLHFSNGTRARFPSEDFSPLSGPAAGWSGVTWLTSTTPSALCFRIGPFF
jgi:hypothetical protein